MDSWLEKKNWKDVKNPDLWQALDAICHGRQIEWNWIKGHAGHAGNEMADTLANQGAAQIAAELHTQSKTTEDTKNLKMTGCSMIRSVLTSIR